MADHFDTPTKFGVGQPVRRYEDVRLLTGRGHYQDDNVLPRQAWCVFVRSPHAHANITGIDTGAAKAAPGVVAVYTSADYVADGIAMPKANMPRKKRDGSPMFAPQRPALIGDRVRYVGDPVAMVIAETLAEAKDAAELVMVDGSDPASGSVRPRNPARPSSGTRTATTSPTPSSVATKRPPAPPSRKRNISSAAATSSPACTRSSWSRAARSACSTSSKTATRSTPT